MTKYLFALAFLLSSLMFGTFAGRAQEPGLSKIVFYVACYDVGRSALAGLKGVSKVTSGFHGLKETNTVYYDPSVITPADMTMALQAAGTYRGIVE